MSRYAGERYIYGAVTKTDHLRIRRLAAEAGISQTNFVRMCINDWLESVDEPMLESVRAGSNGQEPPPNETN